MQTASTWKTTTRCSTVKEVGNQIEPVKVYWIKHKDMDTTAQYK